MGDEPDYILDIGSLVDSSDDDASGAGATGRARRWIGLHFECCGVYARVYRRPGQGCYHGRCPKCLRTIRVRVGPDGTSSRFFRAT